MNMKYLNFKEREEIATDVNLICPGCGSRAILTDSSAVYIKSFGLIYLCPNFPKCDHYVGVHKESKRPKGTLADKPTREARKTAHYAFDQIWQSGRLKRKYAYSQLAHFLNKDQVHIGESDIETCFKIKEWANNFLGNC